MVDSGNQINNGSVDFGTVYRNMVNNSRARPTRADVTAYWQRIGNYVRFTVQVTNRSGVALSTSTNSATVHAIVYEDTHVLHTNRFVRAVVSKGISPALPSGSTATFTLDTPELSGVNWDKLHFIALIDYRPSGSSGAYDMLQAAFAQEPTISLAAAPDSVPADGTSASAVTLSNAPMGHRVRILSSRGSVDWFASATGTVNDSGQFVTIMRSSTPGTAILTAQDLTSGQTFATSAQVEFTGGGGTLPPQTGDILITGVEGDCGQVDCPVDGFFMLGLNGLKLPLRVTVDWKGQPPGMVDFSLNGHVDSIATIGTSVRYDLEPV